MAEHYAFGAQRGVLLGDSDTDNCCWEEGWTRHERHGGLYMHRPLQVAL